MRCGWLGKPTRRSSAEPRTHLKTPQPAPATAITLALIASLLWASSFIYIEIGLADLEPISFAALRYLIGAVCLLGYWVLTGASRIRTVTGSNTLLVVMLGVVLYAAVPALQFIGLDQTEAVTFNFVFQAGIPLVLALSAGVILREPTAGREWIGVGLVMGGAWAFFPVAPTGADARGVILAVLAAIFIGGSNLMQRRILRGGGASALEVTALSMTIGAIMLAGIALVIEDAPRLTPRLIVLLLVLGVINTAIAFFIWHHAIQTLRALHIGVIASTQLIFVPIMARWLLDESFGLEQTLGSVLVLLGIAVVNYTRDQASARATPVATPDDVTRRA